MSGRKRAGKDTFASRLIVAHRFVRVAFADPLRDFALALDPLIDTRRLSEVIEELGWEDAKAIPEVRRTLQRIGTEAGRKVLGESVWVNLAMRKASAAGENVVITDCRYPNEAEAIRAAGGIIVRVDRPGTDLTDAHPSEVAMDDWPFDARVINNGTIQGLHDCADRILDHA